MEEDEALLDYWFGVDVVRFFVWILGLSRPPCVCLCSRRVLTD